MSLEWRQQLSVGNDVIDADHKYLIELINLVEVSLGARDRSALMAEIDKLSQYSQSHFVREERIARAVGYPQVSKLGESHSALLKRLEQVKAEIGDVSHDLSPEVIQHFTQLLRSWLVEHVIKEDLLMKPALQKFSPKYDPV